MKLFALAIGALSLLAVAPVARAQSTPAVVVSACSAISGLPTGPGSPLYIDQTGALCTAAGGSGETVTTSPKNALSSDASSTVTTGGTFQTALIQNLTRLNCTIQNNDASKIEPLFVSIASSPTVANSYALAYGATFSCTNGGVVMGDAIKVSAATTGHTFVETSQ